ncbi:class I SAM-dependent methyltransferase [Roseococcus pinisoli]|uniref:Class I SAM-dependent methyltransferase n=1 Tax=Roseococcus pinisoli TaxID=2835040 RepID=A0ABS5QFR7_9PROT|nr:class I SAM-dependent methyltransferase [Roseococcus pinisoli]
MPDLELNASYWGTDYDWAAGGEEWSAVWGGSEAQWFGSLLPRIHRFLPAGSILEIAQGFGRWAKFLLPTCREYVGVELSQQCIDACRITFEKANHARFVKTDGASLPGVASGSVDFVFSFDSLVHVEADVIRGYVPEILRVLAPGGVAFIHHSNLLPFQGSIGQPHARGSTVSADLVADIVNRGGGRVLLQEVINWGGDHLHDCLTLFTQGSQIGAAPVLVNPGFMAEAFNIRDFQAPWAVVGKEMR